MDFTEEEVGKTFPEVKPVSDFIELKKQMGLAKEKYTEKQINTIYQVAIEKIFETKSKMDIFKYIRLNNEFVSSKKDVKNKYNYLIKSLKEDYDNKLDQIDLF